jgi:hypothetical protein
MNLLLVVAMKRFELGRLCGCHGKLMFIRSFESAHKQQSERKGIYVLLYIHSESALSPWYASPYRTVSWNV